MIRIGRIFPAVLFLFISLCAVRVAFASDETIALANNSGFPETIEVDGYYQAVWSDTQNRCIYVWNSGNTTVDFSEYLKGVVFVEMAQTAHNGKSGVAYTAALQAQAVAALNKALVKMSNGTIDGSENVQAYKEPPKQSSSDPTGSYDSRVISAVNGIYTQSTHTGLVMTYQGNAFETFYFSAETTFTRNSEDYGWNYVKHHRRSVSGPNISGSLPTSPHSIGMNQYGAIELAASGSSYDAILKHFYHPAPPYVEKVIATQDGEEKYRVEWVDDFTSANPSRTKNVITDKAIGASSDLTVEIHFSERVKSAGGGIVIKLGNEQATQTSNIEGNLPPEKWTGRFTASQLQNIPDGEIPLKITATHEFATTWQLDSNPATVSFDGTETTYEPGADLNQNFKPFLAFLSVGSHKAVVIQSFIGNTLKFTPGAIALGQIKRYTAPYARGVALCRPRWQLHFKRPSLPLLTKHLRTEVQQESLRLPRHNAIRLKWSHQRIDLQRRHLNADLHDRLSILKLLMFSPVKSLTRNSL